MPVQKGNTQFFGREEELSALERRYQTNQFQFISIDGRRRIGKTALLLQFTRGKECIFFTATESEEKDNLAAFSQSIQEYLTGVPEEAIRPSFQDALERVFQISETKQLILVIDEYPYVAKSSPGLSSVLQLLIDRWHEKSHLLLILSASSVSYMEKYVLGVNAPLYGRRTGRIHLKPLLFNQVSNALRGFSPPDRAMLYGMVGGTPYCIRMIDGTLTVEENMKQLFLTPDAPLLEEPEALIRVEMKEPAKYNSIIRAVAGGSTRLSEIADRTGLPTDTVAVYMQKLLSLGYITKEIPYGEKKGKKTIYAVSDPLFRFWHRFIPTNLNLIMRGGKDLACARIMRSMSEYMGHIFEEICEDYLWTLLLEGKSPVSFAALGHWWGSDPSTKKQVEIDIMGEEDADTALFAECKWTETQVDLAVLRELERSANLFPYTCRHFFLFSRTGFTRGCQEEAARREDVTLVELKDMV